MKAKDDEDDVATDPKTGGFEKHGAAKDDEDDVATDPKTGGFQKPAG